MKETSYYDLYQQIMRGFNNEQFSSTPLKEDGSFVQLSCEGFYNNGKAAYIAEED